VRVDLESFDRMYRREGDPWNFADSDYEQHRYRCSIQALHRVRYRRCFEPGCSIGVLTAKLADRCDEVIACDASAAAIEAARHRLAAHTNVELHTATLPEWWPTGRFDLVVFSELGYYWDVAELEPLVDRLAVAARLQRLTSANGKSTVLFVSTSAQPGGINRLEIAEV